MRAMGLKHVEWGEAHDAETSFRVSLVFSFGCSGFVQRRVRSLFFVHLLRSFALCPWIQKSELLALATSVTTSSPLFTFVQATVNQGNEMP